MRDSSKVIMGATLVMVVSLAIVLGLVLVLLVELYCSILLRRRRRLRQLPNNTVDTASPYPAIRAQENQHDRSPSPLSSFYAQGVLDAPRSFLFPAVSSKANIGEMNKDQSFKLHSVVELQTLDHHHHHRMGIISPPSPISAPLIINSPQPVQEIPVQVGGSAAAAGGGDHFVYISNPIYDNDASRLVSRADTPFETPDTSPSRLETDGSSSGEDDDGDEIAKQSSPATPPLTPMKKLPAEACSVSLRDARSLGTSASDSVSNNGLSSSSSGSPRTSPSW